ncbi:KTSC domain-containing protein [Parasphingorhabdus litoris]
MIALNSRAIRGVSYDSNTATLTIWFTSGEQGYDYYNVPAHVYDGLLKASSHGSYFNHYIRDQYAA